jgi:Domain of unknown function (DUF4386)
MTRTTNARIAGFTYLFYAAIGISSELLMHQARGVDGDAAELARIDQYATNVRLTILITLFECLSALVLAVTLYGITRDEDHELAMLGLVCRLPLQLAGFQHRGAPDRILPVATGARIPSRARAVAAHQRCGQTDDAMSATSQDV